MNKNICHITSVHNRYDERIFRRQCVTLSDSGYRVILLVNDGGCDEILHGVNIISVRKEFNNRLLRLIFIRGIIYKKAINIDADIYQIHDPELIPVGLKLLKRGKKVIFDSHEDFPAQILEKTWIPLPFRKLVSKMAYLYYKFYLKKYSAVLSVTPHIVNKLASLGANTHMITNYPIIVDSNLDVFSIQDYLSRSNNLIYTGTVYPSSQQELVLDSLEEIDQVDYTIVGTICSKDFLKLQSHKSWEKVNFIDFVPKIKLKSIYSNATIALCIFQYSPNLGFKLGTLGSNKLFEYMLHGLPLICSDSKLWKEKIIDKYKCGICVNPYDKNEIVNAINFLKDNKNIAYQMGVNARNAVIQEFNWASQVKDYLNLINRL